jgi:fucose 4-O-acetylase-like acetyltransferase
MGKPEVEKHERLRCSIMNKRGFLNLHKISPYIIFFFIISVFVYGGEYKTDYTLLLDFSAEQTDIPYPVYSAVYLVNTSNVAITFPSGFENSPWMGQVDCYSDEFLRFCDTIMEVVVDSKVYSGTFTLLPGEKVRIFSAAFNPTNKVKYPFSYLRGTVYVNREKKKIQAFFNPQLFE